MSISRTYLVGSLAVIMVTLAGAVFVFKEPHQARAGARKLLTPNIPGVTFEVNGLVRFDASAQAEQEQGAALLASGPQDLTCLSTSNSALQCTPISIGDVGAALASGQTVYHRRVYAGIVPDAITQHLPVFGADEVVCTPSSGATGMSCRPVTASPPTLASGSTSVATYAPLNEDHLQGTPGIIVTKPSVPLGR